LLNAEISDQRAPLPKCRAAHTAVL